MAGGVNISAARPACNMHNIPKIATIATGITTAKSADEIVI
jgi:hypothetical protein